MCLFMVYSRAKYDDLKMYTTKQCSKHVVLCARSGACTCNPHVQLLGSLRGAYSC